MKGKLHHREMNHIHDASISLVSMKNIATSIIDA